MHQGTSVNKSQRVKDMPCHVFVAVLDRSVVPNCLLFTGLLSPSFCFILVLCSHMLTVCSNAMS